MQTTQHTVRITGRTRYVRTSYEHEKGGRKSLPHHTETWDENAIIELQVDITRLARVLGGKAMEGRSGKSILMGGIIKAFVIDRQVENLIVKDADPQQEPGEGWRKVEEAQA